MNQTNTAQNELASPRKKDASYYAKVIIGLVIMFCGNFIPAPAPITQAGMACFTAFVGLIFLVATVDMIWPAFASFLAFGIHAQTVYPNSATDTGIEQAMVNSFGQWIFGFLIMTLLLTYILQEVGLLRRMTLWFVTRKFAKKGPWRFTFMLFLAGLVVAYLLDGTPAAFMLTLIFREIIQTMGFKKGDSWPSMILDCAAIITVIGFGCSPIGHNLPIAVIGMVSGASGEAINIVPYLLGGLIVAAVMFTLMFLYFKFIVKPDMSHFATVDYDVVEKMRPGKMDTKEKIVAVVSILVVLWWVVPGFLTMLAPNAGITKILSEMGLLFPSIIAVVALAIIRVDGQPILNIGEASKKIDWTVPLLFSGIIMISLALAQDATGFPAFMREHVVPLMSGMTPYVTIAILALINVVLTNILNNWAVGVVFATAGAALCIPMGINPAIVALTVGIGCNLAFTTPAACPFYVFACADTDYCGSKYVLKHGLSMTVIAGIAFALLAYPIGVLAYGG